MYTVENVGSIKNAEEVNELIAQLGEMRGSDKLRLKLKFLQRADIEKEWCLAVAAGDLL